MTEKQLKVNTLTQAFEHIENAARPLVRLEVFAAAIHGELWIKNGQTILLAQLQPNDVVGWPAVFPLLELTNANFILSEPGNTPEFPPAADWLEIKNLPRLSTRTAPVKNDAGKSNLQPITPAPKQNADDDILDRLGSILGDQSEQTAAESAARKPAPQAVRPDNEQQAPRDPITAARPAQTESQRLLSAISTNSRKEFTVTEDPESRNWLKRQMKRLTARAQRAAQITFISKLRLGAKEKDEEDGEEKPPLELNPVVILGKIPKPILASLIVGVGFIGLGYWALSEQAKTASTTDGVDFKNATTFAEEQSLTASAEKPRKPFRLPEGSSGPQGGGAPNSGNNNAAPDYPSYYSPAEVEDLRSIVHGGENLMSRGSSDQALHIYLKGLEKYPESVRLRLAAARAYLALGKPNDARLMCLQGIQAAVNQDDAQVLKAFAVSIP